MNVDHAVAMTESVTDMSAFLVKFQVQHHGALLLFGPPLVVESASSSQGLDVGVAEVAEDDGMNFDREEGQRRNSGECSVLESAPLQVNSRKRVPTRW